MSTSYCWALYYLRSRSAAAGPTRWTPKSARSSSLVDRGGRPPTTAIWLHCETDVCADHTDLLVFRIRGQRLLTATTNRWGNKCRIDRRIRCFLIPTASPPE